MASYFNNSLLSPQIEQIAEATRRLLTDSLTSPIFGVTQSVFFLLVTKKKTSNTFQYTYTLKMHQIDPQHLTVNVTFLSMEKFNK